MWKNFLRTSFRYLIKNRLYSGINILGLALGLAACILIGVYAVFELRYDAFHTNADQIVRMTMEYEQGETAQKTAFTGTKPGPFFSRQFPAIKEFTRTFLAQRTVKQNDQVFTEKKVLYADAAFFKIFSFGLTSSNPEKVLDAPGKMVITEATAKRYFGDGPALGKNLVCAGKLYRIEGVCKDAPINSQLQFDFVVPFPDLGQQVAEETWWTANWVTYLLLDKSASATALAKEINQYMDGKNVKEEARLEGNAFLHYHLEPLTKVHLYSALSGFEPNNSIRNIYVLVAIALLIITIASANYTNLASAQLDQRTSEIGLRRVMGASGQQVFLQIISESLIVTGLAAVVAMVISLAALPYFNFITGKTFLWTDIVSPLSIIAIVVCCMLVSLLAGLYPALLLSGIKLIQVIRKGYTPGSGRDYLRKGLIVGQFAISVALISYTITIVQQMDFMHKKDLGYDKEHVLVLPVTPEMANNFEHTKQTLAGISGVQAVTAAYESPEYVRWQDGITVATSAGKKEIDVRAMPVDLDFTSAMRMTVLAGRDFQSTDFGMMDTSANSAHFHQPFLINESLAKKIGWTPQEAIGKQIEKGLPGPVLGVVKDFNYSSLHDPIGPMVIFLGRDFAQQWLLRIKGNDVRGTIQQLEQQWKVLAASRPFNYHFLDESYDHLYETEQRSALLFTLAGGLAIFLACMGIFGLSAITIAKKTKELGIRKVLGAGITDIAFLFAKQFLQLAAIAVLIALPVAWWFSNAWLRDFAYRIQPGIVPAVAVTLLAFALVLLSVSYHVLVAARANPVKSLRSE